MRTRIFVEAAKLKKEEEEEKRKKEREEKKGGRRTAGRGPREEDKVDARHYLAEIRSSFQVFLLSLSLSLSVSPLDLDYFTWLSRIPRIGGEERRGEEKIGLGDATPPPPSRIKAERRREEEGRENRAKSWPIDL